MTDRSKEATNQSCGTSKHSADFDCCEHSHLKTITRRYLMLGLLIAFEFGLGVGALIAVVILTTR